MNFKIKNIEENIEVILIDDNDKIVAKAVCYLKNTPKSDGKNMGTIGEFETNNDKYGEILLKKCEEILKEKNINYIVTPMNGNTWNKYRTMNYTNGEELFLLENVNPIEHNKIFLNMGYKELYTYTSNKGLIENAYESEALRYAETVLDVEKIKIRKFNKENYIEDLKKIYNISKNSFKKNPFYTNIPEEDFIKQYEKYIKMIDDELVLIVEKEGNEIGFIFCIPDYQQLNYSKTIDTLILKTIAVLPEYEEYAIGNILLSKIAKIAKKKNFKKWIFAFMYSNNTSQKMAKRNKTEKIREYVIYGKEI